MTKRRRIYAWIVGKHAGYKTGFRYEELKEKFGKKKPGAVDISLDGDGPTLPKGSSPLLTSTEQIYDYCKLTPHLRVGGGGSSLRLGSGYGWGPISPMQCYGDQLTRAGFTDLAFLTGHHDSGAAEIGFEGTIDGHHEEFDAALYPSGKIRDVRNRVVVREL